MKPVCHVLLKIVLLDIFKHYFLPVKNCVASLCATHSELTVKSGMGLLRKPAQVMIGDTVVAFSMVQSNRDSRVFPRIQESIFL